MLTNKIPFVIISLFIFTIWGCVKNSSNSIKTEDTLSLYQQNIILNDSIYKKLVISYDPSYINYRVRKKNEKFNAFTYNDEYNSLSNLRNYYYYLLQKKYSSSFLKTLSLIKKNNPGFFDTDVKISESNFESSSNMLSRNYIEISCASGLVFNPVTLLCDLPENVDGGDFYYCLDTDTYEVFDCTISGGFADDSYSAPTCQIDNNLNSTVLEFVEKCCLSSIWEKFPLGSTGSYASLTLSYIKANRHTTAIFRRCWMELNAFQHRQ